MILIILIIVYMVLSSKMNIIMKRLFIVIAVINMINIRI
jgi:hypothetical protein